MTRENQSESYLPQYYWQAGGTITVQQAMLGASALTHAAVKALADANKVLIEIPQGWIALEMRFYSDGSEDAVDVIEMYAEAGEDHYRHFAQLTLIVGTQEYGSNKFHDTITPASEQWLTRNNEVSPANDTFGSYVVNTHAHSRFLIIASTRVSATIGVEFRKV